MELTSQMEPGYFTLVIPLILESYTWTISHPLTKEVWYALIICVPMYLLVMGLADYAFMGVAKWKILSGFILRNIFSEHAEMPLIKNSYQKILVITWVALTYLLVQCYAGNLKAMLTAPGLPNPIKNATEFLDQNEIRLVIPKGEFAEYYFKSISYPDTIERKLGNIAFVSDVQNTPAEYLKYGCYSTKQYNSGMNAAICSIGEFWALISYDFSRTGQCNFYTTDDIFLKMPLSMGAFQVWLF